MKITKKLYKRMERCCYWQNKVREEENLIEIELNKLGIDIELMRNNDCPIVDFINYGNYTEKEIIEESLNEYRKSEDKRR